MGEKRREEGKKRKEKEGIPNYESNLFNSITILLQAF
jgi:hypothetical protein